MFSKLLDNPLILSNVFYPRVDQPGTSDLPNVTDGTIPTDDGVVLGYRLYTHTPDSPTLVYFHGNGEIASDYDNFADQFRRIGLSVMVVDYRGYGWSTGKPLISTLLSDAEKVLLSLPEIVGQKNPVFVMGRSLGSAPASHLAATHPDLLKGIIIESGFAHAPSIFGRLIGLPDSLTAKVPDVFDNARKIAAADLPLLVIHGERDTLIPVQNGQELYDVSPTTNKTILRIPGAGHNDLLLYGMADYFAAIKKFVEQVRR
jgi:alpha-beta hydrolase superfamily lysophospholipase